MKHLLLILSTVLFATPSLAQVWYVSPYTGSGTDDDPFRAHGARQGAICKSLRASEQLAAGIAVCKGPILPAQPGVIQITPDRSGSLSAAQKLILQTATGKTITASTAPDLIWELVDANNIPLRRTKDGLQRVVVGGVELASRPAPLASYIPDALHALNVAFHLPFHLLNYMVSVPPVLAAAFAEDWNCPDSAPSINCDQTWTQIAGNALGIVSNVVQRSGVVAVQLARTGNALDTDDMKVGVTLTTMTRASATDVRAGVMARKEHTNSTQTYLYCVGAEHSSQDYVEYGHVVAGVRTVDGTANATIANGSLIEIRVVNDVMQCWHNGAKALDSLSDSTGSGFLGGGIRMDGSGTGTSTVTEVDNWYIEDITALEPSQRNRGAVWLP